MTIEDVLDNLECVENNLPFDEVLNDANMWIDVHELFFEIREIIDDYRERRETV